MINLNCYRSLQQGDGGDEAVLVFDLEQGSHGTGQGAGCNLDPLARQQVRPRLDGHVGFDDRLDRKDFSIVNGFRTVAATDNYDDARRGQNRQPEGGVKFATRTGRESVAFEAVSFRSCDTLITTSPERTKPNF